MLTEEMESVDTGLYEEASSLVKELNKSVDRFELTQLLSGPYDKEGAVITITAGAGGTDAQVNSYPCTGATALNIFLSFLVLGVKLFLSDMFYA